MKTMKNQLNCFCLYLSVFVLIFGLKVSADPKGSQTIKGRVIDSAENTPLPYSTLVLFSSDSVFIAGTITDADGIFQFANLNTGDYKLVAKFLGYTTRTIDPVNLPKDQMQKDLGDILLDSSNSIIDQVNVISRKAQVENHPDKKVVNIPTGGISDGGVVADALVQVPSITLDANRNVLLCGSSRYKVLIDGVPSPLDGNEALKGIAVSNIDKIEVITNPDSSYDSEGSAGIINIIMKKEKSAVVAAQLNTTVSSNGSGNGNFSLMGQGKKLGYTLSFDDRLLKENSIAEITNHDSGSGITGKEASIYDYRFRMRIFKSDATCQIDGSNSIQGLLWLIDAESDQTTTDNNPLKTSINSTRKTNGWMPQLRFNHKFNNEGTLLTVFAQYNHGSEYSEQAVSELSQNQFRVNMDIPYEFLMLREDLTMVLNDKLSFISGLDYKYSGFDYLYNFYRADAANWTKDETKSNRSTFRSDIAAGYLQLKGNTAGFGFQAGVRAENTSRALSGEQDEVIFNYQKLSLFPSFQISRSFGENSSIMAGYSRRLNRPRLFQLNPFRNYSNPGYVLVGNHELVPEFQNTIELSYSQRSGKINFNGTFYGKITKNSIIQTSAMQSDSLFFTYENAKQDRQLGTEISVNWNPANWISCNLSGNLYDYKLDAREISSERRNTQFETSLNLTVDALKNLGIQSFSTMKSKSITVHGYVKGYFTSDLAVSKQFFGKKMRASLKVTDLFNGVSEHEFIDNGTTQWQRYYKPDSRQLLVSLTLNVNKFSRKSTATPEATPY